MLPGARLPVKEAAEPETQPKRPTKVVLNQHLQHIPTWKLLVTFCLVFLSLKRKKNPRCVWNFDHISLRQAIIANIWLNPVMLKNPHFLRITSNYLRMALSLVLGVMLIRVLLQFGEGVFAAVALTASSIGVAAMLKETMRGATIPELGISFHSNDGEKFETTYASSLVLSAIAGLFGVFVLGLFLLFLDYFAIEDELRGATAYFIASRMVVTFTSIFLSPVVNMMPVTGRMVSYNFWLAMERVAEVSSAFFVLYFVESLIPFVPVRSTCCRSLVIC